MRSAHSPEYLNSVFLHIDGRHSEADTLNLSRNIYRSIVENTMSSKEQCGDSLMNSLYFKMFQNSLESGLDELKEQNTCIHLLPSVLNYL